jgi:glycosyltransferase involved in cell wall biosynthesis
MKVCVIIPTYNESEAIGGLVKNIRKQNLDVLVVDDGSADNTAEIARQSGAIVLKNPVNKGKGSSLIRGFEYALSKGFDAVITMDGDGQHAPDEIGVFIQRAGNSNAGVIAGNRMSAVKNMPFVRIMTNTFLSWLVSKKVGQHIPDTQCGYRLLKRAVIEKLSLTTSKYETETEILIQAAQAHCKIESIPIKTIYVREKSNINPFLDTWRFIRFMFGLRS